MIVEGDPVERLGRQVVADGLLSGLRTRLRLTRNAMSELLLTSPITYASWEDRPDVRIWRGTAVRVGRFYQAVQEELADLEREGVDLAGLMPFYLAATQLGVPQELLLRRYREGEVEAVDAGPLGLWIRPDAVEALR